MNAKMARKFRLIATAVAKDRDEYNFFYKTFKRVYSSAKNPGAYFLASAQLAEMFTKDKLEAIAKAEREVESDTKSIEEEAGSTANANSQSGEEDSGQERNTGA